MYHHHKMTHWIIYMIIGTFFVSGICRIAVSEDADLNHKIDLKDAVLNVQRLSIDPQQQSLRDSAHYQIKFKTAMNTLQVVAGVRAVSAGSVEPEAFAIADFSFLISDANPVDFFVCIGMVSDADLSYHSIEIPPPYIPPILS